MKNILAGCLLRAPLLAALAVACTDSSKEQARPSEKRSRACGSTSDCTPPFECLMFRVPNARGLCAIACDPLEHPDAGEKAECPEGMRCHIVDDGPISNQLGLCYWPSSQ